jgi:cell wall-associated NlpC family hydrolase
MRSLGNLDEYVGLPWLERGRDRDGLDCWGLLALVYAERLGVLLPSYRDDYQTTADTEAVAGLIENHIAPWHPVPLGEERVGDALLMSVGGRPRHVGVVVCPGLVLHIERRAGSLIESYHSMRLRRRVLGVYRHESLT